MLALTLSVCLHALCWIGYKNPSISGPLRPPKRLTRHPVLEPWLLKATLACQPLAFDETNNEEIQEWGEGEGWEESSFAFLPTCHVKRWLTKWTLSSPDVTADFGACVPECVESSSLHLSFNDAMGCHLALARGGWWGGGGARCSPLNPK